MNMERKPIYGMYKMSSFTVLFVEHGCHWWHTINDKGVININEMAWRNDKGWWHGKKGMLVWKEGPNDPFCGHFCMMWLIRVWRTLTIWICVWCGSYVYGGPLKYAFVYDVAHRCMEDLDNIPLTCLLVWHDDALAYGTIDHELWILKDFFLIMITLKKPSHSYHLEYGAVFHDGLTTLEHGIWTLHETLDVEVFKHDDAESHKRNEEALSSQRGSL